MRYRSPARFLAPLALIAAAFAVYTLIQPGTDAGSASVSTPAKTTAAPAKKASPNSLRRAKSYVVRKGDTLSGIAVRTGLSVDHIRALNPGLDVNSLNVGSRLKLRT
ncbi:MAG: LysM peptidoglycan-binding protein [Solirubrobacterales bacterium]|nr:LysM peptidoglycan-binding protein [Solirubrobacterales bacterium]